MFSKVFAAEKYQSLTGIEDAAKQISGGLAPSGNDLNAMINQLVYILIGVAIGLAILMLIRGGFEYMTSTDSGNKIQSAKNKIWAAVGGVGLALSAILILQTINPNILDFSIRFPEIKKIATPPITAYYDKQLDWNNDGRVTYNELQQKFDFDGELEPYLYELIRNSGLLELNPKDLQTFLPEGNTEEGWARLISYMIQYESGFDPTKQLGEKEKDGTPWFNSDGKPIVSTGLLQLSYESVNGYGFNVTTNDLKDPYTNLAAGVKILKTNIQKHNIIAPGNNTGGGAYWSVLRSRSVHPGGRREDIVKSINQK